jgi:hypothetical protein
MMKRFLGSLLLMTFLVTSLGSSINLEIESKTFRLLAEEAENLAEALEDIFPPQHIMVLVTEIFAKEYPFPQVINLKSQLFSVTKLKPPRN